MKALREKALKQRVGHLMDRVSPAGRDHDKLPNQSNGGEPQRICLARALTYSFRLVVLDELVSFPGMNSQGLVLDLLDVARRESRASFLFITHDLRVIFKMAIDLRS